NSQLLDRFYVEDADRTAGILVRLPPGSDVVVQPGDIVKTYGRLGTGSDGERQLVDPVVHIISISGEEIEP
ncbi:MAG: hypothetical protein GTN93_03240, partial [Anaerolineae bacterium]|nr:hypothetical protein [Anaerolineae bacterium]